ncbi:MAG: immunoglobulin-like domain-containing protein, partial [Liquorilactobacillus nagelii]|uniref:immunoglobulin-like domain-containing protein n=1 Tax=Liquorilactobacillus nagelii TaxID=82688 RepID=UPI0039E98F52
ADQHKTVYYNNQGQMLYGQQQINGHWYLFDNVTGAMKTGLQYIADQHKTVYYNNQGQMLYGTQKINNEVYTFDKITGALKENVKNGQYQENGHWYLYKDNIKQTGFQYITDQHKTVYYNNQGQMLYGWQTIQGKKYYFETSTGARTEGKASINGNEYNFDKDGVLIVSAPTFTGVADTSVKKSAGSFDPMAGVSATDSNGNKVDVSVSGSVDTSKSGSYTLTYSAKDADGNTATATRKVTVVNDVKPAFTGVDDTSVKESAGSFDPMAGVSATDSNGNKVDVSVSGSVDTSKSGSYTLTYSAKDADGNTATATRKVTVVNDVKPAFTGVDDTSVKESAGSFDPMAGVSATDSNGNKVDVSVSGSVDTSKSGSYTLIYSAKDADGNTATATRKVTVVNDVKPAFTGVDDTSVKKSAGSFDPMAGVSATDSNGNKVDVSVSGSVDTSKSGSYTLIYSAKDADGNTATATRKVTVVNDVKPAFTGVDDTSVKKSAGSFDPMAGVSATDSNGNKVDVSVSGSVDTSKSGSYTLTYSAKDADGNTATATRKVTVVNDVKPTINNANDVTIGLGENFDALKGVSATDSDGNSIPVTLNGQRSQTVDTSKEGNYTIYYDAEDSLGNTVEIKRVISVKTIQAKSISISGPNSLKVGQTSNLKANFSPDNTTNKTITWSSSNTAAATIDDSGNVKGVGVGSTTITAETPSGIKSTFSINVDKTVAASVEFEGMSTTIDSNGARYSKSFNIKNNGTIPLTVINAYFSNSPISSFEKKVIEPGSSVSYSWSAPFNLNQNAFQYVVQDDYGNSVTLSLN